MENLKTKTFQRFLCCGEEADRLHNPEGGDWRLASESECEAFVRSLANFGYIMKKEYQFCIFLNWPTVKGCMTCLGKTSSIYSTSTEENSSLTDGDADASFLPSYLDLLPRLLLLFGGPCHHAGRETESRGGREGGRGQRERRGRPLPKNSRKMDFTFSGGC